MERERRLIADFESCRLDPGGFHHADHIQLGWAYVREHGPEEAERRLCEGLRRLTAYVGVPGKYHETITLAWTRLVAWAVAVSPECATFEDFSLQHGWLLEKEALLRFYSRERLMSAEARGRWLEPDVLPLPCESAGVRAHAA